MHPDVLTLRRIPIWMVSVMISINALRHRWVVQPTSSDALQNSVTKTTTLLQIVRICASIHRMVNPLTHKVVQRVRKTMTTMVSQMQMTFAWALPHSHWSMKTVAVRLNWTMIWTKYTTMQTFVLQHLQERLLTPMVALQANSMTMEIPSTMLLTSVQ